MKRSQRCACGALIIMDDATCTIRHQHPPCAAFTAAMEAAGMKTIHGAWVEVVDPVTGKVKEPVEA